METDMKKVELYNNLLAKLVRKPKEELLAEFGGDSRRDYVLEDGTVATVGMTPAPDGGFPSLSIDLSHEVPAPEQPAAAPALPEPVPGRVPEPMPEPVPEPAPDGAPVRKPKVSYPDAIDCVVSGYSPEMSWRVLQVLTLIGQLDPAKIDRVVTYIRKIM